MKLLLVNQSDDRLAPAWLKRWLKGLSQNLQKRRYKSLARRELVLVFVKPAEIRRLNRLYRGKDKITDVLSFAPAEKSVVGELVLCLPVIRRQAVSTGFGERGELGFMIVHGVLHLLGFDHEKKSEELKMFALQEQIYQQLVDRVGLR